MGKLFDKREKAHKHSVREGDRLTALAAQYKAQGGDFPPDLTWEDLAVFNWATSTPREVLRALCERVGTDRPDALRSGSPPETLSLNPKFGPDGPKEILIPKVWKSEPLDQRKTHKIVVKERIPACAIAITNLDKWFIPAEEPCDIEYTLEGEHSCANQVDFEVYGSKYCRMQAWNEGLPSFIDLPDVPVFKRTLPGEKATARASPKIDDWKGEANCAAGLLAPGPDAEPRVVNVAFSPYTVVLRYSKGQAKTARIELAPFWLRFEPAGKPVADSCKVTWTVKGTDKLKFGMLQISDKMGDVVFTKGLAAGDLARDALKSYQWDGKLPDGANASTANMPYRVRIDAHTDIDEADGLAIAAMHTEVRLFVDKLTHESDLDPYLATTDKSSLDISLAELYHKDVDPVRGDGRLWTKFELARAGFHPGPVSNGNSNPHFETALNEFQRSVPKHDPGSREFKRLTVTAGGNDDDDTRNALENLSKNRRRPWFGKPADRSDWDPADPALKTTLRDATARMIVWVDDRNWYTDGSYWRDPYWSGTPQFGMTQANLDMVHRDPANFNNNRGSLEARDARVDSDARDIARPWIPLQVGFRLLSRKNELDDPVPEETVKSKADAMRKAIGPLRVDWTFDEIEQTPDLQINAAGTKTKLPVLDPEVDLILKNQYHRDRNRTRVALGWALDQIKDEHQRVDIKKLSRYYNAPVLCGGIRPKGSPAQYFSQAFGLETDSLVPWTAKPSPRQSVYNVVHDQMGQGTDFFFRKRQGLAGIYFHPSRIAGDGYQVRAQVQFRHADDYKFPNVEALRARYSKLPQAQSAQFRLWRKTSLRGYVCWGPTNTWTAAPVAPRPNMPVKGPDGFREYYTPCYIHIVNEIDTKPAELNFAPGDLMSEAEYKALVKSCFPGHPIRAQDASISLSPQHAMPWSTHPHFGVPEPSGANLLWYEAIGDLCKRIWIPVWLDYSLPVSLQLVKGIEKRKGWMRGHVIVEFVSTPQLYLRSYQCSTCNDTYVYPQNVGTAIRNGTACPKAGCTGMLALAPVSEGHYVCTDPAQHTVRWEGESGGSLQGQACQSCPPPPILMPRTNPMKGYQCAGCGDQIAFQAANPPPPPCAKCGGVLNFQVNLNFNVVRRTSPTQFEGLYVCQAPVAHGFWFPEPSGAGGSRAGDPCPTCSSTSSTLQYQQVELERYKCDRCNAEYDLPDPALPAVRGGHQNEGCPACAAGKLISMNRPLSIGDRIIIQSGTRMEGSVGGVKAPGLPTTSSGYPVGISWDAIGDTDLWGHELGHNRFFEHAGTAQRAQNDPNIDQDCEWNLVEWPVTPPAKSDPDYYNRTWDRSCLMSYITDVPDYDQAKDLPCFCFKCVLKNRGWKLNAPGAVVPMPPGDVQDYP